jgi:predicted membrane channel-forming protein YqfA (hemolysin III family)
MKKLSAVFLLIVACLFALAALVSHSDLALLIIHVMSGLAAFGFIAGRALFMRWDKAIGTFILCVVLGLFSLWFYTIATFITDVRAYNRNDYRN